MEMKRMALIFPVTIRDRLQVIARKERRSMNNLVNLIVEDWLQEVAREKREGREGINAPNNP